MSLTASDLASRLSEQAAAVCRYYLSNGHCAGNYWIIGDVRNTPGRSMFVRLKGPAHGRGAAGHWNDAATGEHGDLLDVIRETCGFTTFGAVANEARRFLNLPRQDQEHQVAQPLPRSLDTARRLFAMSEPIAGTLAETYLHGRGIANASQCGALRFHPCCYYRKQESAPVETWPAMIARVTTLDGSITGVHRTWLDPLGNGKAPLETPRRALGHLLGQAVRFGDTADILAVGEGIETMLSLRTVLPSLPVAAALSAPHLAALLLPANLRALYIARDMDAAGHWACASLIERASQMHIETYVLTPRLNDFNDDLRAFGSDGLRGYLAGQFQPTDVAHFLDER